MGSFFDQKAPGTAARSQQEAPGLRFETIPANRRFAQVPWDGAIHDCHVGRGAAIRRGHLGTGKRQAEV
jgi:hypothetical protein